jgi:C4-dicarboxylate-specific signal transduction histidine kinase
MGELAAGLAHELNQPLAAIAAFADGAALRLKQGSLQTQDLTPVVERIAADAQRAGEIIRRMRKFVLKRPTELSAVNLNGLIRETVRFLDHELARGRVSVDFALAEDLPLVQADAVGIQQVVLNLIRNSLEAMLQKNATARRCLATTTMVDRGTIALTVEDSGSGVPTELRQQVFDPFFTSKEDGLGMGLAISRSIVEAHRGRIDIAQSRLGGACVCVTLPIGEERGIESR